LSGFVLCIYCSNEGVAGVKQKEFSEASTGVLAYWHNGAMGRWLIGVPERNKQKGAKRTEMRKRNDVEVRMFATITSTLGKSALESAAAGMWVICGTYGASWRPLAYLTERSHGTKEKVLPEASLVRKPSWGR
jgi:hypothetical protein